MMNIIQSPSNATTMMKRTKTSILPDPMERTNAIEILGHYWPRVLRNQNLNSVAKGKNNDKVIKKGTIRLHRRPRKTDMKKVLSIVPASPLLSSPFAPLSPSSSSSSLGGCPSTPTTTTTTKDVICPSSFLVLDGGESSQHHQQQRTFSPITGRPISPVCIKKTTCCGLLPDKSLRAMIHQNRRLRRRSSKSHAHSHHHQQQQQVLQH